MWSLILLIKQVSLIFKCWYFIALVSFGIIFCEGGDNCRLGTDICLVFEISLTQKFGLQLFAILFKMRKRESIQVSCFVVVWAVYTPSSVDQKKFNLVYL